MIIGCCGAGKSTLAKQLHQKLSIELIHLDRHYWKPEWIETEKAEWVRMVEQLSDRPSWIIDGNYGGTMEIRMKKADTIIFLHYDRWLCLFRVIKRILLNYGKVREDMGANCPERWSWEFITYVYHFEEKKVPGIYERLKKYGSNARVLVFRNPRETASFLSQLDSSKELKQHNPID